MEGGMSYVGTMVCRHDEKGRICLLLSRGLFTTGRFSGRFFRIARTATVCSMYRQCFDYFLSQMSFEKKKRTYLKNKKFSSN